MTTTFDDLAHHSRQIKEAMKAVIVTPDWNATDTLRAMCWKVLTGNAPLVVVRPTEPKGVA